MMYLLDCVVFALLLYAFYKVPVEDNEEVLGRKGLRLIAVLLLGGNLLCFLSSLS